ncbi:MAG: hypothetical protein H0T46_28280 [Deltaproteobacteria bacterium]|nr:hypothetical protein [Deltaproteobacteria bacterium]
MKKVTTRLGLAMIVALFAGTACNKPSEESCQKALANMQTLLGTEHLNDGTEMQGEVRRCRGGSSRKAVDCAVAAKTLDELKKCDFMKVPDKK